MPALVNVVIPPLAQPFTYRVADELAAAAGVGARVEVPFGRRTAAGYIIAAGESAAQPDPAVELKTLTDGAAIEPCFRAEQLDFFTWTADYYGEPLATVIDAAVPPIAVRRYQRTVRLCGRPAAELRGRVQSAVISALEAAGGALDYSHLLKLQRGAGPAIKALAAAGVIAVDESELIDSGRSAEAPAAWAKDAVTLSAHQRAAVDAITAAADKGEFTPFLLHGVTGSGKTEVYIEALKHVVAQGRGALIIVPEIALTPQLVDRFRARFGDDIAVLHSGLHRRTRWESWRALLENRCRIAIGARSGIFAPIADLGLIIVDEEHDSSYKQSDGLRYNGRDLALVLARRQRCPVVLGSATPALETLHHARTNKYRYLSLPARHSDAGALSFELVDLNKVKPWEMAAKNVSPQLQTALAGALERGEQSFVLYNRRGFASYLQCERCEAVVECPNCSVTFTYHQRTHELVCHYCSLSLVPSEVCTACESPPGQPAAKLVQRGAGTEKIFDELKELFPTAAIDRLDRDAASDHDAYKAILARVRSGATQILVGTQMIAKGHDLPNVTVVGVADCDVGLHMPDFRASERVFQLLTQAAGRAGRGSKPGTVVLQTRVPRHPSLVHTLGDNYIGFAEGELAVRAELAYPPFSRMLRIVASSQDSGEAERRLLLFRSLAQQLIKDRALAVKVLGPAPAPLERLRTSWRWHMILKAASAVELIAVMRRLRSDRTQSRKVKVTFDMDPQEML